MTCCDLMPMLPPPHFLRTSALSLNCALKLFAKVSSSFLSSLETAVRATQEAAFLWTSWPNRPLPLMMQYGTSFLRQSAGNQHTSSMGSTSWAMTTSLAALFSTSVVTWFRPSFFCCAISMRRFFLASRVSGMYFLQSFRTCAAWFLSMVQLNWLMAGGTLRRMSMIFFARCKRTYLGHLMKRVKSRLGWMSPPTRKVRGAFSKRGFFCTFFFAPAPRGALGKFFLELDFPFGAIVRNARRSLQRRVSLSQNDSFFF